MSEEKSIVVAKNSGFCFGVGRACDFVCAELQSEDRAENIYTLGKLIHNDTYNSRLESMGVHIADVEDICQIAQRTSANSRAKIFVRAHGMTKQTEELLDRCASEYPYFSYVDCTCSFVKKIHRIVEQNSSPDGSLLVLGSTSHPEVVGFCSRFEGKRIVFSSCDELMRMYRDDPSEFALRGDAKKAPVLVAQTTQNLFEWKKIKDFLSEIYDEIYAFDTICSVTEKRQTEAVELSRRCDFMIVIGSRTSSNSAKLYSICCEGCQNTIMVEHGDDLLQKLQGCPQKFPFSRVGIAAGASTPPDIISEVESTMRRIMEI